MNLRKVDAYDTVCKLGTKDEWPGPSPTWQLAPPGAPGAPGSHNLLNPPLGTAQAS